MVFLDGVYKVKSNREAGYGRYDISLTAIDTRFPSIIIEIKQTDEINKLKESAKEALMQIKQKSYFQEFVNAETEILLIGLAFFGKTVEVEEEILSPLL